MPANLRDWAGPDGRLGCHIYTESQKTLDAYQSKETLVQRDANEEAAIARAAMLIDSYSSWSKMVRMPQRGFRTVDVSILYSTNLICTVRTTVGQ